MLVKILEIRSGIWCIAKAIQTCANEINRLVHIMGRSQHVAKAVPVPSSIPISPSLAQHITATNSSDQQFSLSLSLSLSRTLIRPAISTSDITTI